MEKEKLEQLINDGLSSRQIAEILKCSQTNIRHWIKKFGLNTKHKPKKNPNVIHSDTPNGIKCVNCSKELTGFNTTYCDNKCKTAFYYKNNKETLNANTNERQRIVSRERKLKLIEMSGGKCELCGYNKNYSALTYHHIDPSNKVFTLDSRNLSNTNWESILEEHKKCQLLCSNCHAEIHNPNNEI